MAVRRNPLEVEEPEAPQAPPAPEDDLTRFTRDYWAPDREGVLNNIRSGRAPEDFGAPPPPPPAPPPVPQYAPPGFDQTKWANPAHTSDKYTAGRMLSQGSSLEDVVARLGAGWRILSPDKVAAPDGRILDTYFDYGGPNQRVQWTDVGWTSAYTPPSPAPQAAPPQAPQQQQPDLSGLRAAVDRLTGDNDRYSAAVSRAVPRQQSGYSEESSYPTGAAPSSAQSSAPGRPSWANTAQGQTAYNQMKLTFPDMSDEEIWSLIGYPQAPDRNFLNAIVDNVRKKRYPNAPPHFTPGPAAAPAPAAPAAPPPPAPAPPPQAPSAPSRPSEFADPWGSSFEGAINERLRQLQGPPEAPKFPTGTFPELDELVRRLKDADARRQGNVNNYVGALRGRIGELNKDPYTTSQEAVLRAKAFDQLERRRQQTLKNRREELYMRGHAPTSGTVMGAEDETNRGFEEVRTDIESDLLKDAIDEGQRRKDRATQLEGFVNDALNGADLASLQYLTSIADLEDSQYRDRESRQREILATYAPILDLLQTRQNNLFTAAGMGGGGGNSIINSIMGLLNMGNQNAALGRTYGQNNTAGLAQLLGSLPMLWSGS